MGHGFFWTLNDGCGQTADGTGFNVNEAQTGRGPLRHRLLGRARRRLGQAQPDHAGHRARLRLHPCRPAPAPAAGRCTARPRPRARRPGTSWRATSPAPPFNYDSQTAFIVGNKLFYQGSGNIGAWHACTCGVVLQRLRRHQRLHAVAGGRRRQRQPQRRHAAHDARSSPPSTATASPAPRPPPVNSGCAAGPTAAADAHRHAGQLPGAALLERRRRAPPATGCSAPRATPAATSARR